MRQDPFAQQEIIHIAVKIVKKLIRAKLIIKIDIH